MERDSLLEQQRKWNGIPNRGGQEGGMGFPIGAVRKAECNSRSGGGDSGTRFPIPAIGVAECDSGSR